SVEFYPIADPAAELSRYRAGELDITENIPPGRYAWLQENHGPDLRVSPYLGSFWLGLNLSREPFSGKTALRQALSLAIDRETLVRVVLGAGELPAWSVVPPGLEGHQPWRPVMADLSREEREAEARRLFAQSGHEPGAPLRVELRYNSSSQHRRMAIAVAAMWKQVLGVATELINEEWKVFVNNRSQRVLTQVFRGGWIADYADPASFLDLFHSGEALNWSAYANPQYDQLLERARRQTGTRRMALLQQAEVVLMRDMPVIPLYYYVSRHLVRPGVEGYIDNLRDIHLSRYMDISEPSE
ncbi:MAG TPA: peptide ABC transporter substrate-binding protein, partial [Xanthomonadales bacterium]|nr:peptide ABC transporter substrate-binding protein [Xanthomonadales bacterium]